MGKGSVRFTSRFAVFLTWSCRMPTTFLEKVVGVHHPDNEDGKAKMPAIE
jgi:hypothetical protein